MSHINTEQFGVIISVGTQLQILQLIYDLQKSSKNDQEQLWLLIFDRLTTVQKCKNYQLLFIMHALKKFFFKTQQVGIILIMINRKYVYLVCFALDRNKLAFCSTDNSIRLWDVKTGQEIKSSDKNYKDILEQFKIPFQSHRHFSKASNYITTLLISQSAIFQAQGTLILKGEFINHQGKDLKPLFKSKESCFLQDLERK
ncbi:unnamed protein product [Paramecium primaurelia]|uniref:Uncharacterized protein n=1 Tax=Paramecium primaurelia TaxID=5886 RepID=A0A8S1NHY7_PARPR|nr:unnamed protein product [Paramecium primaurelia]CAD8093301.1 unnamed protein product [Paramecium primaurelia]